MAIVPRIVAAASLDATPFVFGIRHDADLRAGLSVVSVSETIRLFREGAADFALLPVSAIPRFDGVEPVTGYCIGSRGAIRTAVLAGSCPPSGARRILFAPDAPAETLLAAYLFRRHWRTAPAFVPRTDAGPAPQADDLLLLTDTEALDAAGHWPHLCDLGAEWTATTRQPFAFAVWIGRPGYDPEAAGRLHRALTFGLEHTYEALLGIHSSASIPALYDHIARDVDYIFDLQKHQALRKLWDSGVRAVPRTDPG